MESQLETNTPTADYMNFFEFQVTPEDEQQIRNLPKLPAICQFLAIFKSVLRINMNSSY